MLRDGDGDRGGADMRVVIGIVSALLSVAAIWLLSRDILPPKELRLAAGMEGGGYWQIAEGYAAILAADGIAVEIVPTAGSVENAALLEAGAVEAALMQGGVPAAARSDALGALFYEPVWIFLAEGAVVPANPGAWDGVRIAAGGAGSGTRSAFDAFVAASGAGVEALPLSGGAARDALRAGEVDAAFFVARLRRPICGIC